MGGQHQGEPAWLVFAILVSQSGVWILLSCASGQLRAGEKRRKGTRYLSTERWRWMVNPLRWTAHLHFTYAHQTGGMKKSEELCAALSPGRKQQRNMLEKNKTGKKTK